MTGVQTCALPISAVKAAPPAAPAEPFLRKHAARLRMLGLGVAGGLVALVLGMALSRSKPAPVPPQQIEERPSDVSEEDTQSQMQMQMRRDKQGDESPEVPAGAGKPPAGGSMIPAPQVKIVDSVSLPWASPTAGQPPTLAYLPPGSQLILLARPAEIVADAEGRQFVRSLGPRVAAGISLLGGLCGCGLEGIVEIQAGWQAGAGEMGRDAGDVLAGWAVRLVEPSPLADDAEARARAWGATTAKDVDGETIHVGGALAYWLPAAAAGRVLVMAPPPLLEATLKEAQAVGGEDDGESLAASLPQDLQSLVGMLDRTRHLTLLGSPHYLQTDGRPLMAGPLARLVEPLGTFFGDGVRAAALSLHCGETFYAEIDAIATRAEIGRAHV